jgi:hypothetical protein
LLNPTTVDLTSVLVKSRLESIEWIDITGSSDNTLNLSVAAIQDITSMNWLNASTKDALGVTGGTYNFSALEQRHQMVVDGDVGDTVEAVTPGSWIDTNQTVDMNGQTYVVYNSNTGMAQLFIDSDMTRVL